MLTFTRYCGLLLALLLYANAVRSQSNLIYATTAAEASGSTGVVQFAINATDTDLTNAAIVRASSVVVGQIALFSMSFTNNQGSAASPVTVYIKTSPYSKALLGGDVTVRAYDQSNNEVSLKSAVRMLYTADGFGYLAVTPNNTFRSVRIRLAAPAIAGTNELLVYYAFISPGAYNDSNPYPLSTADCGRPYLTAKSFSAGLLANFDVANADKAIDNQLTTKSSFSSTSILTSGWIKQTFYFKGGSGNADAVRIVMSAGKDLLDISILQKLTVRAYNGDTQVGEASAINALALDVLGLITPDNQFSVFFAPKTSAGANVVFDRIEVELSLSGVTIALGSTALNIHDVRRVPDVVNTSNAGACTNIGTALLRSFSKTSGTYSFAWYDALRGGNQLSSNSDYAVSGLTTTTQKVFYVQNTKVSSTDTGCEASERAKVTVTVNAPPVSPPISLKQ